MTIDLNADVGEGCDDEKLLPLLSSVNVACGGHAGDEVTMARTVERALGLGLAIGAHPSHADREHFGRRELAIPMVEIQKTVAAQVAALEAVAARFGARLTHVKPHGALYNQAARDPEIARAVVRAVGRFGLRLVGLAGSELVRAGSEAGLVVLEEAFADRRYRSDGSLAPRVLAEALVTDESAAAAQALAIVRGEPVTTIDGPPIVIRADTICLHGDTPEGARIARAVRERLERAGVKIAAYGAT